MYISSTEPPALRGSFLTGGDSLIGLTMRGEALVVLSFCDKRFWCDQGASGCAMSPRLLCRRGWHIFCTMLRYSLHLTGVRACRLTCLELALAACGVAGS